MNVLLVSCLFLLMLFGSEALYRFTKIPSEWTRKFQHIFSGLVGACLPWMFSSPWEVAALGAVMTAVLFILRKSRFLTSLHDVKRQTHGEFYFLLSVVILAFLSWNGPRVFYFIPLLTLTFSDSLAAIVGTSYKKHIYSIQGHIKSLEGSATFLISTILTVLLPLLFLSELSPFLAILTALNIALIVTGVEAVGRNGLDNLLIPLSTYLLLVHLTTAPLALLSLEFAGLFGLAALLIHRLFFRSLDSSGEE